MHFSTALLFFLPCTLAAPQHLWPRSKDHSSPSSTTSSAAGSIDLSIWNLQLPVGEPGHPTTIKGKELANGYSNPDYFFTDGDELVMKVPGGPDNTDCVTTPNSEHCRTELRESAPSSWDPHSARNVLRATLTVVKADDSKYGTVVGQIHIDEVSEKSTKPVCELFYSKTGKLIMGVEETRNGNLKYTDVGSVPLGTEFTYEIRFQKDKLSVLVNGKETKLSQYQLDSPNSYFKAGNYNQGSSPSEVRFKEIVVEH